AVFDTADAIPLRPRPRGPDSLAHGAHSRLETPPSRRRRWRRWAPALDLPHRKVHNQPIELRRYADLTAQATLGPALGDRIVEHRILPFADRLEPRLPFCRDIDVACRALAAAATF